MAKTLSDFDTALNESYCSYDTCYVNLLVFRVNKALLLLLLLKREARVDLIEPSSGTLK